MSEYDTSRDKVAIAELKTIEIQLSGLIDMAVKNTGKSRPIVTAAQIELLKDHLDLVVKYTRIS